MSKTKIIILAIFAYLGLSTHAQNADSFDPNATGGDDVLAVAVQPDGNIIIGGGFTNVVGIARSNLGGRGRVCLEPKRDRHI